MKALPLAFALLVLSESALAYFPAYNRAMVLGRANGVVRECSEDERIPRWQELAWDELSSLSRGKSELDSARTRYGLETRKARNAIRNGETTCQKAWAFWEDQFNGLQAKYGNP